MNAAAPQLIRPKQIGPNAVTRVAEALHEIEGDQAPAAIFRLAALEKYLVSPPQFMVDEGEVAALHRVLHTAFDRERARRVAQMAGRKTADYLLRRRIPRVAQALLRALPATIACRLLANAIARNAWTFAGSGTLTVQHGRPTIFTINACPLCRGIEASNPTCDYYAATFERLFATLVDRRVTANEVECLATGGTACRFAIGW
jgi:divinyl protochlorophyllide a 8-vinyl-reductase